MFNGNRKTKDESILSSMKPETPPKYKGSNSLTGFDPEGLERAAKAARDLDASRNAVAAIELIKTQEATKQHDAASKRAEYNLYAEQMRASNIDKEAEQARKTLEAKTQHERSRAEYSDELERKRQVDMLNAQKYIQEEQLKKQEEMVARQESMRRKTAELESRLRTRAELEKVSAETQGRIKQERDNHDLILEKVRLTAAENRDTILKAIQDGGKLFGDGIANFLSDKKKLWNTSLVITGIATGVYTTKMGVRVAGRYIESRLGKPSLVRETSRITVSNMLEKPFLSIQRIVSAKFELEDSLKGIVLQKNTEDQLKNIATSTSYTTQNRAPFRHLLLYGPPGTGKTLFARRLAQYSGLDYAIFTGGDIAPLGPDAVTELHKLFEWAKTSRRGLLLFIDEADAFLQCRGINRISEDQRNALNAFLYRTGVESNKFMIVYASNQPSQFDEAILDRIDEMVLFELPGLNERRKMISMYFEHYLINYHGRLQKKIKLVNIGEKELDKVAHITAGFSGRAIAKLVIAWQAAAYGTDDAILNQDTLFKTLENQRRSMFQKNDWITDAKKMQNI